ncbi:hypothetical protein Pdw03_5683 [Penicillium digitatum]|uniref:Uncharacterized protein n=1 Tax=Penicillium digitatum TaxID=36651 RepID=A0A7T6XVE3_PENDI|nr:hypothetical protein Pdw03_5683 [Penicillium digitatum]
MTQSRTVLLPDDLDLAQLRLLGRKMIRRNNARAEITHADTAIRMSYAQLSRDFPRDQLPDVFVAVTNAMNCSLAILAHRWRMWDIEEEEDLESIRLLLWRP